jgi:hypothetical protein
MVTTWDYPQIPATISCFARPFENKRTTTNIEMQQSRFFQVLEELFTTSWAIFLVEYDVTGIITAAYAYHASRAVILFTVCPAPPTGTQQIKKIYCRNIFSRNDELNLFIYS